MDNENRNDIKNEKNTTDGTQKRYKRDPGKVPASFVKPEKKSMSESDGTAVFDKIDFNGREDPIRRAAGPVRTPANTQTERPRTSQGAQRKDVGKMVENRSSSVRDTYVRKNDSPKPVPHKPEQKKPIVSDSSDTVCVDKIKLGGDVPGTHRAPAVSEKKEDAAKKYVPLATENDDFEIDEDPIDEDGTSVAARAAMGVAKAVIYIVAVVAVSALLAMGIITAANDIFAFVKEDTPVTVVIPEDCDLKELSEILGDAGAVKYPWLFKLYSEYKKNDLSYNRETEEYEKCKFIPGTYDVSPMLNYDYMISTFKEKSAARTTVVVTIPEGYSTDQIVNLLIEKGLGTKEGYIRAINEYDEYDYKFLNELTVSEDRFWRLDGYLYPDTYYYFSTATEETIIYKMLENFNSKLTDEYYERAAEMGMSFDELVTLASMIQKEVKYADEYGLVSSVFHNRLNNSANFPYLESDATIVYAIEHETGKRPERLTETSYASPYNTYKNKGLPPGPICNPTLETIRYAMYPTESRYYYFVSGASGKTQFSRTYSEHLQAIKTVE